jgi:RHS repeat-associated protein
MQDSQPIGNNQLSEKAASGTVQAPTISLPKGGGAIQSIGEKFCVNPANGTAAFSVPLFTTPSRSNFHPQLSLSYDSGNGNGPFGLGWKLSVPAITRKTDKGLPRYRDAENSDIFVLSDAEDLVPSLIQNGSSFQPDVLTETGNNGRTYFVKRYRPRVEALFARIEKWQDCANGDTYWQSVSKDNVTSCYGLSTSARIADPADPTRIFQWLLEQSFDDKGNAILYEYKEEDTEKVPGSPEELNRLLNPNLIVNRYLKRILYGKKTSAEETPSLFQVVFDYGEHAQDNPTPEETATWPCRADPFSNCHPCFEIRTYRLCQRILMFHSFSELDLTPTLVRSTDLSYNQNLVCSYLNSIVQTGYLWDSVAGKYQKSCFPPIEFTYSQPKIDPTIQFVDRDSLENLPIGLDQVRYRWTDLDSEGISGILAEQTEEWFYKRNLGSAKFAPVEVIRKLPSVAQPGTRQELLDLAGDGRKALVQYSEPSAGYSERDEAGNWGPFTPFRSNPNISWNDPNLKMIDLNGDGFSDILISEDETFVWCLSQAKLGFGEFASVRKPTDEERGPALVFSDPTQSIFLADMTGDGLVDIVRIRNGEVCYWENLGYGRFGPKVQMDHSPLFDHPDNFDQKRIRLADIDGSGTTDILYLRRDSVIFWFNQSGNSWGERQLIADFPLTDDLDSVLTVDLFGNGTSCILWSSPLADNATRPIAYIDLMSGQKPHLLTSISNNMGKKTHLQYAASTQFYLEDCAAGQPWITRLPFPVQVVRSASTFDGVSKTQLTTSYSYHHGYYDGVEREFRGFGMVEQWDTESFADYAGTGEFPGGAPGFPSELYVPPMYTKTWFHTGVFFGENKISRHIAREYYQGDGAAASLSDTVLPAGLTGQEEREACRALKGRMLRQEIYAEDGTSQSGAPYSITEKNFTISLIQPFCGNPHAVFFTSDRETLAYHYERNPADPRISHEMALELDSFGNVTESLTIGYPRRNTASNSWPAEQLETLCTYREFDFINQAEDPTYYRVGVPCGSRSYQVTGLPSPSTEGLYEFTDLQAALPPASVIPYETSSSGGLAKRLFQQSRTLYFKNDLSGPLPLYGLESLALPYQSYEVAFTAGLLTEVYGTLVNAATLSTDGGYLPAATLITSGLFPPTDDPNLWWLPSGSSVFDANQLYLPVKFTDPFANTTVVTYDGYSLLLTQTVDPLENVTSAVNDYRTMQPSLVTDSNGNQSQATFDALGMMVGTAVMGKTTDSPAQGDSLTGFVAQLDQSAILSYIQNPLNAPAAALQNATMRLLYDLGAFFRTKQTDSNGDETGEPVVVFTLSRETHVSDLGSGQTKFQHQFLYSDGFGRVLQTKIVAEPGLAPARGPDGPLLHDSSGNLILRNTSPNPRWIGTGRTVYDNKGNPVKKYEPFFSSTQAYEDEKDLVQSGVTPILHYDPLSRLIRTDNPNGTFTQVEFDPWQQITSDENDTVLESLWYSDRGSPPAAGPQPTDPEARAAWLAAQDANTPTVAQFDVIGRTFLTVVDNGLDANGTPQKYPTHASLDIQGSPLVVTDARGNQVMASDFDMLKRSLHSKSPDAGERWTLPNVLAKPIRSWDSNNNQVRMVYDELHRPTYIYLQQGSSAEIVTERLVYADRPDSNMPSPPETSNLRGKIYQSYDAAGVISNQQFNFKGNLLQSARQLATTYQEQMDWTPLGTSNDVQQIANNAAALLESAVFTQRTKYDALNRPVTVTTPDDSVTQPSYNERRLLLQVNANVRGAAAPTAFVKNLAYNEKGQRTLCFCGNGVQTAYTYDPKTYRLANLQTSGPSGTAGTGSNTFQDLTYYYDPVGNIVETDDAAQQAIFFNNSVVTANAQYSYDATYRLVSATGREHLGQAAAGQSLPPAQYDWQDALRVGLPQPGDGTAMANYTELYQYDPVGNITQVSHQAAGNSWIRYYQNDTVSNRLLSTSLPGDPTTPPYSAKYQYDNNGNTKKMMHLPLMQWTYKNELQATSQQVVNNGGTPEITYYVYDASGKRVRKVTEGQAAAGAAPVRTQQRIYLDGYEIYDEYAADGTNVSLERETLHVMDDERRVAMVETKTVDSSNTLSASPTGIPNNTPLLQVTRYQFENHLGSACLELDDSAAPLVISYEEYYPYGSTSYQAVNSAIQVSAKRYRYTGKERDDENGFYYHGARYYAPWLGRWASCDPIGVGGGTNLYRFVDDNPMKLVDPTGRAGATSPLDPDEIPRSSVDYPGGVPTKKLTDAQWKTQRTSHTQKSRALKGVESQGGKYQQHHTLDVETAKQAGVHPDVAGEPARMMTVASRRQGVPTGNMGGDELTHHTIAANSGRDVQARTGTTPEGLVDASAETVWKLNNTGIDPTAQIPTKSDPVTGQATEWGPVQDNPMPRALVEAEPSPFNLESALASQGLKDAVAANQAQSENLDLAEVDALEPSSTAEGALNQVSPGEVGTALNRAGAVIGLFASASGGWQIGTGLDQVFHGDVQRGLRNVGQGVVDVASIIAMVADQAAASTLAPLFLVNGAVLNAALYHTDPNRVQ